MPDVTPNSQIGGTPPVADPVAMISALLDAEKVTPDTPKPAEGEAQPEADAEHTPALNAQVEGDETPAAEGEKTPVAEIPLDQLEAIELEVEVSGPTGKQVEKVPIKEMKLGYMRQKDYQTKTAEVARQREEVGQKVRQGIESERTQYAQTLQQVQALMIESISPELKNADWNKLAVEDPAGYVRLLNQRDQYVNALNTVKQKQQELQTKAQAEKLESNKAQAQKTWAALESDIPGWNNTTYEETLKAGESLGYTKDEVGAWLDARAIKLLHKAYLYDQLKAGKPPAEKKVAVAPKAIAPGATSNVPAKARENQAAMERLRKTGNWQDMASVIASHL